LKCDINNQVLTYPSWCVIRGQGEVAEAAQALHGRILDSFADGLDAMEGITVMETTFTWQMLTDAGACASLSDGANAVTDTQARFTTGNGKVVGAAPKKETQRTESEQKSTADVNSMRVLSTPGPAVRCGTIGAPAIDALATGEERGVVAGRHPPHQQPSVVTPLCTPVEAALVSPESAVAAAAAQASVAVIRASVVRRRGALLPSAPKQRLISPPVNAQLQEQQAKEGTVGPATVVAAGDMGRTSGKLCSAPFVIRRAPANRDGGGGGGSGSGSGSRETGTRLANESQSKVPRKSKLGRRVGLGHEDGGGGDGDAYVDATLADRAPQDNQSGGDGTGMKHGDIAGSSTPITPQHAATSSSSGSGGGASNEATPARVVTHGTPDCGADQKNTAVAADSVNETSTTRSSASTAKKPRSSKGKKRKQPAVERPTKLTVTFSTQGSLGMGMAAVDGEEDTYELESKAPTSAAAGVPNGWHFAEVDGKNVRNIGGQKLAELLRNRPVSVTFEKPPPRSPPSQPPRPEDSEPEVEPDVASVPKKRKRASKTTTATASAGTAAATTSDGISRNEGDLAEPQQTNEKAKTKAKPKTKAKSKKSAAKNKVTTVRKVFKVQTVRKEHGGDGVGGSASASASTSCGVGSKNGGAEG
ncbi:unnamed protein product, partial [Sphacelaria rigidula]